jgi:hypothetical protein
MFEDRNQHDQPRWDATDPVGAQGQRGGPDSDPFKDTTIARQLCITTERVSAEQIPTSIPNQPTQEVHHQPRTEQAVPSVAPSCDAVEVVATDTSAVFSPSYFIRDLTAALRSGISSSASVFAKVPLPDSYKKALLASVTVGVVAGTLANPIVAAGVGAIVVWQAALRYEKNSHARAIGIIGSVLYTTHMTAVGMWELSICNVAATLRQLTQSMIADHKTVARGLVAIGGFAATAGVYAAVVNNPALLSSQNIPILTLGLGALSGAFSERYSWASRLTGLSSIGFSVAYHLQVTQSSIGIIASLMFAPGILVSIWEYDLKKNPRG